MRAGAGFGMALIIVLFQPIRKTPMSAATIKPSR